MKCQSILYVRYIPREGQNRTLDYGKWVKIIPLTLFEAILHEIGQI